MEKLYQMRYEDDLKKLTGSTVSKNMPDIDTGLDKPMKLDLSNYATYKDMVKVDKGLKTLWNNDENYLKDKAAFLIRVEDNLGIKVCNIFNQLMLNNIDVEISMMKNISAKQRCTSLPYDAVTTLHPNTANLKEL